MKVIGSTQALSPDSSSVDITSHLATALGARNGATLYAIGFRRHVRMLGEDVGLRDDEETKAAVGAWQVFLNDYKLKRGARAGQFALAKPADGRWGKETTDATKDFQRDVGEIDADGKVGRQTLSKAYRSGFRTTSTASVATIVATPFPTSSWHKLLRLSVIREPKPRGARDLLTGLTKLGLVCRFVEVIQPLALGEMELFSRQHLPRYRAPRSGSQRSAIMTPIDVVVELPEQTEHFSDKFARAFPRAAEFPKLFAQLAGLIKAVADSSEDPERTLAPGHDDARNLLDDALRRVLEQDFVRVASLKPMHTLNALALRYGEKIRDAREKRRIGRRQKPSGATVLTFDISPWHALLWHQAEEVPPGRDATDPSRNRLVAVSYADSEEKFICWNFYDLRQRIIVEFDVEVPSDVADYLWRGWVYDAIGAADGDVIASYTSPRLRDGGLVCSLIVVFPFLETADERETGDVGKIIGCFDELLGGDGRGEKYAALKKVLADSYHAAAEHAVGENNVLNLLEGTAYHARVRLDPVRIWSPEVAADERVGRRSTRYRDRFKSNPFFFTHAMTRDEYDGLYAETRPDSDAASHQPTTRLEVAEQIVRDFVTHRENIAVVGAHRCGKSTVLNLVHTQLVERLVNPGRISSVGMRPVSRARSSTSSTPVGLPVAPVLPLRINAALTPIREFPQAIIGALEQLERDLETQWTRVQNAATRAVASSVGAVAGAFRSVFTSDVALEVAAMGVKARLSGKELPPDATSLSLDQYLKLVAKDSPAYELRRGLKFLQQALTNTQDALKEAFGQTPTFLVIIDEVRDGLVWGDDQAATAAWRSVIEAPEFASVRWLVASTRPMRQELAYSPVSNVFREKNLGCLSIEEAQRFLDAFGAPAAPKLAPVLTPLGRKALLDWTGRLPFLMQVACSHVFERATERDVPVVTIDLCRRTLRETVAMEMSDYFAQQWEELGNAGVQSEILVALQGYASAADVLVSKSTQRFDGLSPSARRALSRSGLEGADGGLAPLAAYWLLSTTARATSRP